MWLITWHFRLSCLHLIPIFYFQLRRKIFYASGSLLVVKSLFIKLCNLKVRVHNVRRYQISLLYLETFLVCFFLFETKLLFRLILSHWHHVAMFTHDPHGYVVRIKTLNPPSFLDVWIFTVIVLLNWISLLLFVGQKWIRFSVFANITLIKSFNINTIQRLFFWRITRVVFWSIIYQPQLP